MSSTKRNRKMLVVLSATALMSVAALPVSAANASAKMSMPANMPGMNMPKTTQSAAPIVVATTPVKTYYYTRTIGLQYANVKVNVFTTIGTKKTALGSYTLSAIGVVKFRSKGLLDPKGVITVFQDKTLIKSFAASAAKLFKALPGTTTAAVPFVSPTPEPSATPVAPVVPVTPVVPVAPVAPVVTLKDAYIPTFGTANPTSDGYTIQIANYDPAYSWTAIDTAGGKTFISTTGQVTVINLAANTATRLTVNTSRSGYKDGTATSVAITVLAPTSAPAPAPGPVILPPSGSSDVAQATLTISNTTLSAQTGAQIGLTTSGGSGTGIITFAVAANQPACAITGGNNLIASAAGTCNVIALKAASTGYLSAVSVEKVFTFSDLAQTPILAITNSSFAGAVNTPLLVTTSGGAGNGSVTLSVDTVAQPNCVVTGLDIVSTTAGTCTVTATKAASVGWLTASSTAVDFTFTDIPSQNQATLTITYSALNSYTGTLISLATNGGSGSGSVSYWATGTGCTISGTALTSPVATSCVVTAVKAPSFSGGVNYVVATSAPVTFTFTTAPTVGVTPQTLTIATPVAMRVGSADQILQGYASSGKSVGYASNTTSVCTVLNGATFSTIHAVAAGTCSITGTQAGDATFNTVASTVTFTVISSTDTQIILVFDLNGGTSAGITSVSSQVIAGGTTPTLPTPVNSTAFSGWYVGNVGGTQYVSGPISSDTVLVAKWA